MKLAASNLTLPVAGQLALLPRLAELGIAGLEISPDHAWRNTWHGLTANEVERYRRAVATAGLGVVGLSGVFDAHPQLNLLGDHASEKQAEAHLVHLSAACRDLGGRLITLGTGRRRGTLPKPRAWIRLAAFMERLLPRIEAHGTVLCLQPRGPDAGEFCHTAQECRVLASALDHPSFGLQLNACALMENGELGHAVFAAIYGHLDHFVANEPDLQTLGASGRIDHPDLRRHLASSRYRGWVTLEQRAQADPIAALAAARDHFNRVYERPDNLTLRQHMASKREENHHVRSQ